MPNIIWVPFRETQPVDMAKGLGDTIENQLNQPREKFAADLRKADELRHNILNPQPNSATLDSLTTYYAQLVYWATKFPAGCDIDFMWYGTLAYSSRPAPVVSQCLHFERCNILYNLGSLYSQMGVNEGRQDAEGLKMSFNYFQMAAGCFTLLIETGLVDLDSQNIRGLEFDTICCVRDLMLAQAQECFWQRSLLSGTRNTVVSKLAQQVSVLYDSALAWAQKSPQVRSEWAHHMTCKRQHFLAVANYRLARDALDNGKYGEEIARLRAALAAVKEGTGKGMLRKYLVESVADDLSGVVNVVTEDLKRAEKDNDLIYLQAVPLANALAPIVPALMVKCTPPLEVSKPLDFLTKDKLGLPLFTRLTPFAFHQAVLLYSERRDKAVSSIESLLKQCTVAKNQALVEMNLPGSLDSVEKPRGIPADIIAHSDQIRSERGLETTREAARDVQRLAATAREELNGAIAVLEDERAEDEMLRRRAGWSRPESQSAGEHLYSRLEELETYLVDAAASDELVRSKLEEIDYLLSILNSGRSALENYLPSSVSGVRSPDVKRRIPRLRDLINHLDALELKRAQYMDRLSLKQQNDDIEPALEHHMERLISEKHQRLQVSDFEPIISQEIGKYDKDREWASEQQQTQKDVVATLATANEEFRESLDMNEAAIHRENAIQSLEVAYFQYQEQKDHLDAGRNFYNQLLGEISTFFKNCKNFVYERKMEGASLEHELSSMNMEEQRYERAPSASSSSGTPLAAPQAQRATNMNMWRPEEGVRFG